MCTVCTLQKEKKYIYSLQILVIQWRVNVSVFNIWHIWQIVCAWFDEDVRLQRKRKINPGTKKKKGSLYLLWMDDSMIQHPNNRPLTAVLVNIVGRIGNAVAVCIIMFQSVQWVSHEQWWYLCSPTLIYHPLWSSRVSSTGHLQTQQMTTHANFADGRAKTFFLFFKIATVLQNCRSYFSKRKKWKCHPESGLNETLLTSSRALYKSFHSGSFGPWPNGLDFPLVPRGEESLTDINEL